MKKKINELSNSIRLIKRNFSISGISSKTLKESLKNYKKIKSKAIKSKFLISILLIYF